ncbi:MAG TPA: FAD-dependent oxidoreductase [Rhodobacteraceae bacterium]|jgi:glycine/D-amino acid oxidase-like deaminating enzyme|nr:FAD-dependent oxidoreductase [Paracoccaceae bacterium]HBV55638.1 FAD-dependent oxidoreductase [Paracoccaceae bacterium]
MGADYAVIGGGVVGLSVAWGLLARGHRVTILDGEDGTFRASRGNFGLIWVQSKGLKAPHYARWTQGSAALWSDFSQDLASATGESLSLTQNGGWDFHLTEESLAAKVAQYEALRAALGGDYPFEVLGNNALRREEPEVGPRVAGAILHHQDGHVNPLRLLRALAADVRRQGATVHLNERVTGVEARDGFRLTCASGRVVEAGRVVLCAGLGAMDLGPLFGFAAPVRPQRGQVLVTEKLPKMLNRPSGILRQVDEGGIQIGDSKEEVGLDDGVTLDTAAGIAARAIAVLPRLEKVQMLRAWGALRIMSPDGLPIYQKSKTMPGAALVTCHSGITLAAAHARLIPKWLDGDADAPDLEVFSETRFS